MPMEPVMQLRHLRWARSAQLLNAVRSTPGITRTAAARSLGMGSGTATGLIERMRGGTSRADTKPRATDYHARRTPRRAPGSCGRDRTPPVAVGPGRFGWLTSGGCAGPTAGRLGLARALTAAGFARAVAAPSKLIRPCGDRVKTYKPQWHWFDGGRQVRVKAQKQDHAGARKPQPFGHPWFPNKALGAGCADWACETSITFARTWHQRMGLTHDFDELYLTSLPVDIDDGWRVPHRGGSQQPGCLTPRGGRRRRGCATDPRYRPAPSRFRIDF